MHTVCILQGIGKRSIARSLAHRCCFSASVPAAAVLAECIDHAQLSTSTTVSLVHQFTHAFRTSPWVTSRVPASSLACASKYLQVRYQHSYNTHRTFCMGSV